MIIGGLSENDEDLAERGGLGASIMLPLAVATSIDALAVGISFAVIGTDIFSAAVMIGIVTFFMAMIGIRIGNVFGAKISSKAEIAGGIILILIGLKILLEHLGIF
jgi:putative Mn2+ efflux pump MntP